MVGTKVGTKGEIFECDGRVAVAVPPAGMPGAISWEITWLYPAGRQQDGEEFPAWADAKVGTVLVRINPNICQPPYARLADCLAFVWFNHKEFPRQGSGTVAESTFPPTPHPNAESFVFFRTTIAGHEVVMIDTKERAERYSPPQEYKIIMGNQRLAKNPNNGNQA